CAGLATEDHLARDEENRAKRAQARVTARRLIREHDLPMKVVGVDYVGGPPVFTVYFSAPHRVDFRALVRDLASRLSGRVELRQGTARVRFARGGPRPGQPAVRRGGVAAGGPTGRGQAPGGDRAMRPRSVLRDVPQGLRAGVGPDGQGPGPAGEPAADRRRLRQAHVLPQVRAPALPGLSRKRPEAGRASRHPRGRGRGRWAQRPGGQGRGPADRGRPQVRVPARQRLRVAAGLRGALRRRDRDGVRRPLARLPGPPAGACSPGGTRLRVRGARVRGARLRIRGAGVRIRGAGVRVRGARVRGARERVRGACLPAAGVLLAGLVATGCSAGGAAPSAPQQEPGITYPAGPPIGPGGPPQVTLAGYYAQKLRWRPCDHGFQCARLLVPFDYQRPGWRRFSLPVIRLPDTRPRSRIGSLVVNPGGPGASGVQYALEARSQVSAAVRARFDVVGFDPRGVAGSIPAVHCLTDAQLDRYFATSDTPGKTAQLASVVTESKLFARGCQEHSGALLPYVGTADAARDMDVLRAALGDAKLTYLGKSYGTYLGTWYAQLFPA